MERDKRSALKQGFRCYAMGNLAVGIAPL